LLGSDLCFISKRVFRRKRLLVLFRS
jgi:hypothetical protein